MGKVKMHCDCGCGKDILTEIPDYCDECGAIITRENEYCPLCGEQIGWGPESDVD